MNRKLLAILVANLFAATSAVAADDEFTWRGTASIGGIGSDVKGAERNGAFGNSAAPGAAQPAGTVAPTPFRGPRDGAKASEYRDLDDGVLGNIDVEGNKGLYYLKFLGENIGRDDQYYNLRGGHWGMFKYQLFYDEMPHNLSWNALTPFTGTGGTTLLGPTVGGVPVAYPPSTNPATWNSFDYKLSRKNYGGNVELTLNSPWFIRADYNEMTMDGIRPYSTRLGTGSSNGFVEFGAPVDYKTKNLTLEGGYSVKRGSISISFLNSKFENANQSMQFSNFYMRNGLDTQLLPADNELTKWSVNGTLRQLPFSSTLAGRFTYSKLKSDVSVLGTGLLPTNTTLAGGTPATVGNLLTTPSSPNFNGDHKTTSASLSYTSSWTKTVDSRIYYNYYDKENSSTAISYAAGGLGAAGAGCGVVAPPGGNVNTSNATRFCIGALAALEPYRYTKNNYGFDVGWRFLPGQKASGGFDYLKVERNRADSEETKDSKLWLEYKNSMLEMLTARVKYQYLDRSSELDPANPPAQSNQPPTNVQYYFRAYDVSNLKQDQIKVVFDVNPMPFLDIGLETAWKKTEYKDLLYGRTDDKRTEYNFTVSYGDPKVFRVTGLANWEEVEFNQAYHQGAFGGATSPTVFDWGTRNTQTNKVFALIADWPVYERFKVNASYTWIKTGGGVDFSSGNTAGAGGFNGGPLVNYVTDNTKKQIFNLRGDYKVDKRWTITGGYSYEKYDYTDDQMAGYSSFYGYFQNLNTAAGQSNLNWLTGAFANPAYKLNLFYLYGSYKFD